MVGDRSRGRLPGAVVALALTLAMAHPSAQAQTSPALTALAAATGVPAAVPPRVLAVIPERHVARPIRIVDELTAVGGGFDVTAEGLGLTARNAIALRTRESGIPIYLVKSEATVSTALQLRLGASVEITGLVVEHEGRFVFVASSVRATAAARGL